MHQSGITKIVDPLSGNGFVGRLLQEHHLEVECYDLEPHSEEKQWTLVKQQDAYELDLKESSEKALLLSWVPYLSGVGEALIKKYLGPLIIWIGEIKIGECCGNGDDLEILYNEWNRFKQFDIPQYPGLHDTILVFKRRL